MQSLLATGLTQPEDVLQHCLALYRKADLAGLQQYLPDSYVAADPAAKGPEAALVDPAAAQAGAAGPAATGSRSSSSSRRRSSRGPPLPVGPWFKIQESGPLAPLAGVLDVGARRVLPGHLLRRSRVLSTLQPSPDTFQQRIALTACTGETSVFDWRLQWEAAEGGAADAAGGGGTRAGRWVLESVRRDPESDFPLPTTPHPM